MVFVLKLMGRTELTATPIFIVSLDALITFCFRLLLTSLYPLLRYIQIALRLVRQLPVKPLLYSFLIANVLYSNVLVAQELKAPTTHTETLAEQWENLGRIYQNKSNPILQELWLLGRYQGQYYVADGPERTVSDYETRRARIGGQARMFEQMTLHAQMLSGTNFDPVYNGFTELWVQWAFSPEIALTIGQQKHRFTHDRNVSSRYLNYLERAMLTNMFVADYTPAVTLQGTINKATYYAGIFSNATGTDMSKAFFDLDSGYSLLGALYYNIGSLGGSDTAFIHTSYVHSDANEHATNLNRYHDGISTALILTKGSGSFITELLTGIGGDQGSSIGVNVQPGWFITDRAQLVGRYQLAHSFESQGLIPQRRYEQPSGMTNGDLYQALYAGLDYYIAKHRFKLMHGVEYSSMNGQYTWTFSSMIRFYFGPHSGGAFPMNQLLPGTFFEFD